MNNDNKSMVTGARLLVAKAAAAVHGKGACADDVVERPKGDWKITIFVENDHGVGSAEVIIDGDLLAIADDKAKFLSEETRPYFEAMLLKMKDE